MTVETDALNLVERLALFLRDLQLIDLRKLCHLWFYR
jgi:hypothetical protein